MEKTMEKIVALAKARGFVYPGSEFNSSFLISTLYSLLNNRLGAKLPTIVTTNITDGALLEKLYTEKISSRLSSFVPFLFMGDDIRAQKAEEA